MFFSTNVIHVCFTEISDDFLRTLIGNYSISVGKQKFQKRTLMKLGFSEMEIATHHFATRIGQGGSATFYKVSPYTSHCLLGFGQLFTFQMVS